MNNRGALTLDFIFAIVLVTSLAGVLMSLSLTLVVVEGLQYMAFATSRAYFGGHLNIDKQAELSKAKFEQLKANKGLRLINNSSWFVVKLLPEHDFRSEYPDELAAFPFNDSNTFVGTKIAFEAKVLDFRVPLFGKTASDGQAFKANINSFLGREPSFQECIEFVGSRWDEIKKLEGGRFSGVPSGAYAIQSDNGC
jgi:hypothetical protein